jgi:trimeric autotransporter adhesin
MRMSLGISTNFDRLRKILVISLAIIFLTNSTSSAQTISSRQPPQAMSSVKDDFQGGRIHGVIKEGTIPLSGVRVIATSSRSRKKFSTITDGAGAFAIDLPSNGSYSIRAVFRALTSPAKEVVFDTTSRDQQVDFSFEGTATGNSLSSLWPAPLMPPVVANAMSLQPAESNAGGNSGAQFPTFTGDAVFSGDSFSITGQPPIMIPYFQMADQMRQDFEDGHELQGPSMQPSQGGLITDSQAGSNETPISGNQNIHQIHGAVFWNGGYSVLNAKPYLLAGESARNPSYNSNNYGLTVGGQPYIPGLTKPSAKDSILLSFSRLLSSSLVSDYGIVPTDAERKGDFSQLTGLTAALIPIYNPKNSAPFPNNTIDTSLDSAATAILQYLPEPNLPAAGLNYHLPTTQGNHTTTLGVSYTHTLGAATGGQIVVNSEHALIQSFDLNFNLADIAADIINVFPQLGGKQTVRGYALTAGYSALKGEWDANLNVTWTRNDSRISNHFTNGEDVATQVGVLYGPGVPLNSNPLNYGLPNLVFNNFTGMSQTQPNFQVTQTIGVSGSGSWSHGSHIVRFGGDFHRVDFDLFGGTDATGTYVFTGGFTQIPGTSNDNAVATSGSSFADFLLGYPLQTKIEAPDQKAYTRQNNWDLFVRDDWRVLSNLTLIAGLRYDYFSPYVEDQNRLSTLDYTQFTRIAPVQPNGVGPVSGAYYPRTLIYPDRDRFSPHLGFAWQATRGTGVRGGYGINSAVASMAPSFRISLINHPSQTLRSMATSLIFFRSYLSRSRTVSRTL